MKLREFSIIRYGPLPSTGRISLGDFNLFFGRNEDGKTLTIDALVKLLMGRNVKDFERIDRVEESPEGYVVIEDDKGNEIKVPEKGDITDFTGLTPSECRNIFVIRDSDLSITPESEFFTHVTDRLIGSRTEEISAIKKKLQELGRLTRPDSSAALSDREEFGGIKSRVENARGVLERIAELQRYIKEEGLDELEERLVHQRGEIERIAQEIERLEDARKREKYEKGAEALNKFKEIQERLSELQPYTEVDEQLWRDCERDIQRHQEERARLGVNLQEMEQERKEIDERLKGREGEFRVFEDRMRGLDTVKPEVSLYGLKYGEWVQREHRRRFWFRLGMISTLLLGISLFGLIFRSSLPLSIAAILFLLATVAFFIPQLQSLGGKVWLAGTLVRIKSTLSKFEMSAETIEEINAHIQRFEEEYRTKSSERQEMMRRKETVKERIAELQGIKIPQEEERITKLQEEIDAIKRRSGIETREEYVRELQSKQRYEKSFAQERGVLLSLFGPEGDTVEQDLAYWDQEIKGLEGYRDKSQGLEYDEGAVAKWKREEGQAATELNELTDKMAAFRRQLEEVEREANRILQGETDYVHCKTLIDLAAVHDTLHEFIAEYEHKKDSAIRVMEIFEAIEAEEKEMVSELFGAESSVARYFADITGGLYEDVTFNQGTQTIEVRRRDGVVLSADKLSGGTYDQLYLAIRLALGEKLLQGARGFFIMDDPLVKADPERLLRQLAVLKRISELRWQVLYFSAKGEVRDLLREEIDNRSINYVEVHARYV